MAGFPADESSPGACSKEIVLSVLGTHANPAGGKTGAKGQGNSDALLSQEWAQIGEWLKDQENLVSLKDAHTL